MLFIKEIEISNILGCQFVHLIFPSSNLRSTVYVIQGEGQIFHSVATAVQLICSLRYSTLEALAQHKNLCGGSVRLILLIPKETTTVNAGGGDEQRRTQEEEAAADSESDDAPCTSQQARQRELRRQKKKQLKRLQNAASGPSRTHQYHKINALRDFRANPLELLFSVDDGLERRCTLAHFQKRFGINMDYILSQLDWLYEMSTASVGRGNWLKLNATDMNDAIFKENLYGPLFEHYVHLFMKYNYNSEHFLSKLTKACLLGNIALNVIQKAQALKVFRDVRSIFEFITCNEFTVWFLIPLRQSSEDAGHGHVGDYVDIDEMITTDNLDFDKMRTCIQLKSKQGHKTRRYIWTDTEDVFQDLLLVAFQLALAFHCKRRVIYIQNLQELEKHQAIELVTAALLQKQTQSAETRYKNYLQRIIDVCLNIQVTAIIEYSGGLPPFALVNANVIKCFQIGDSGVWNMKVVENEDESVSCTWNNLADYIETNFKNF